MASLYRRPETKHFSVAFYPKPGAKVVRASLGTDDTVLAEKATRKVELLCELEKFADVTLPVKILAVFSLASSQVLPTATTAAAPPVESEASRVGGSVEEAIRAYLISAVATNVPHAQADKISRLRQFFGSEFINSLDPRPPEQLKHARKGKVILPWFEGSDLSGINKITILKFLLEKKYGLSSKRHYREMFHQLFTIALQSGIYRPPNPYCVNPADDLPGFTGRDEPIVVLLIEEVATQYGVVAGDSLLLFGVRVMIEAGLRLHELLALRRCDLAQEGKIRLLIPRNTTANATLLKTGERTITVREVLRPIIRRFLNGNPPSDSSWCFQSPDGTRMTTDEFGAALRDLNRAAGLSWTSQDFRHTFATERIRDNWNLKTLADEMGTSIAMLMQHYAGYIAPPMLAAYGTA